MGAGGVVGEGGTAHASAVQDPDGVVGTQPWLLEVPVSDEVGLGHDGVVVVVVDFGFPNDKVWIVAYLFAGNDPCLLFC